MGYEDFCTATPEPTFAWFLNFLLPGVGSMMTAYFKEGGFCFKTFAKGLI